MSILNVNQIQPVGGGNTITVTASDVSASGATITATSFVGPLTGAVTGNVTGNLTGAVTGNVTGNLTGNVTGNVTSSSTSTFSSGINVTGGSVGIGTDNPARKVEIFDTAATVLQLNGTNANGTTLRIKHSGTDKMYMGLAGDFITGQIGNVTDSAVRASGALLFASGGGTERLRITSAGRLGINRTSPTGWLHIHQGDSGTTDAIVITNTSTTNNGLMIGVNSTEDAFFWNGSNTSMNFATNNTERLRITSSGLVQIGTITTSSFPDRLLSVGDHTRTSSYIDIRSGTVGALLFADGTSGNTAYRGQVEYTHSDDRMCFWTAATERVRISNIGHITTKGNNQGNPVGIEIKNVNTNAYSHAELALTSQNATTSKIWCDVPNSGMRLNYNGGSSVKIDQSGNLHMPNGAGIDFSATANSYGSMGSEVLDDYEENIHGHRILLIVLIHLRFNLVDTQR